MHGDAKTKLSTEGNRAMKLDKTLWMTMLLLAGLALGGCPEKKGPFEKAGEKMDEAVDEAGDKLDEAKDEVSDKLDEAADEIDP